MKIALCLLFCAMASAAANPPDAAELQRMAARFTPTELRVDVGKLSAGDRRALPKLVAAARVLDDIYMDQLWSGNRALHAKLQKDASPLGRARLHYFRLNKGPWSDLDGHNAFLPDVPPKKPESANFYPADMTKQEFETWSHSLPENARDAATGFFTVIRRDAAKKLTAVPYSVAYKADLERAAQLLREAAAATDNASLKKFLTSRAAAFLSNDYYQSDVDWMDLDAPLDITIGPYETYTDELLGYKAAFEAYVNLRDDAETAKLGAFAKQLQAIEDHLPIDAQYRNPKIGATAPIRVVNQILSAGDGAHGVATAAYNLPNDERVVALKGAKRVMLKNVQEAKFKAVLVPLAKQLLAADEQKDISFDSFFTHILMHELTHGLGPQQITVSGRKTSPRQEIKELYGAIEEAKADVTGLFALQFLMDQPNGVVKGGVSAERQLYTTFLASAFRSLRFGVKEAHGRGMAMQMNYLLDKGGFVARPDGTFAVDYSKIKSAVRDLDHDLLTLEARGDYAGAKKMLDTLAVIRPEVQRAIDKLASIPVDIEQKHVKAEEVTPKK